MTTRYTPTDKILRLPDVKARTGLSRSSIYNYIRAGNFPEAVRLGPRTVGWLESAVEAWIASLPSTGSAAPGR